MAELKTQRTKASVASFLEAIPDATRRADAKALAKVMRETTGVAGAMWGSTMVGFGDLTCFGSRGKALDWFPIGFSPRKAALTIYLVAGVSRHNHLLKRLGPHKTGKGCLYISKLEELDPGVLKRILKESLAASATLWPS